MLEKSKRYLDHICRSIGERPVGSQANQDTADFLEKEFTEIGWKTEGLPFKAMDWQTKGATVQWKDQSFEAFSSPYSPGVKLEAPLAVAQSVEELGTMDLQGKVLLLLGEIAKEPLMPKNFVFFNPDEHKRIVALLEEKSPLAIITATAHNAMLSGGVYPFPMLEDGDFNIPSVYMTAEEGLRLMEHQGQLVRLHSEAVRIPSLGRNVSALKGNRQAKKIVVTAHLDTKIGTPGAIDNGTGLVVLLLLAQLLKDYQGPHCLELLAFNGEDYYAVSGQMAYIAEMKGDFSNIQLNINIDGAGYKEGPSALTPFNLPPAMEESLKRIINGNDNLVEGAPWYQGDHSIFLQAGVPALAATSKWFLDNGETQTLTHTPKDNPEIVEPRRILEITEALREFILSV